MGISTAAALVGGMLLASQTAKQPNMPKPATPEKPRQVEKAPGIGDLAARNRAQNAGGLGSTYLTGSAGVDPGSLNLGGNTLLGG